MRKKVYDIKNCGPRSRFVVRGGEGCEPMIVHNCTQGLARDLLAEALIAVETSKKYLPVLHVHDEVVAECKKGEGDVREFEALISQVPTWAEGLPLEAEGWVGKRYRK